MAVAARACATLIEFGCSTWRGAIVGGRWCKLERPSRSIITTYIHIRVVCVCAVRVCCFADAVRLRDCDTPPFNVERTFGENLRVSLSKSARLCFNKHAAFKIR